MFNLKHWNKEDRVIAWDVMSYYSYLPATFIYGDVTLNQPNENFEKYHPTFWYHQIKEGKKVFKTSMGMAILYAPFFFVSHAYTVATSGIGNGFSPPYKFAICMSSLFYFCIGLIFLKKILENYFSNKVVALTLLFIGLGTNLYYYVVIAVGYPHNYLFCLLAITIYLIHKWYTIPSYKTSAILGLLLGLMVLVRPTMIFVILFFSLFQVYSLDSLKERLLFFQSHYLQIFTIALSAIMIWIPQFIYWKIASGNYLFYSYTEEGFFFNDPQIFNALFSFRKGWLLYTPIMVFALIGLVMLFKNKQKIALGITTTVVVYFYVASCWWDWWFGGSFGYRAMIDIFPLLAFGMACFIEQTLNYSLQYKIPILSFLFLLLGFNLFQTRQAHEGLIHHDSMTKAAYFKILFKLQSQITREEINPLLKAPDYEAAKRGERNQ
ncbi:MAG: hypothetical protein J5I47_11270 [Vicingus serpentipes]|nr:hypothetical protein [Vicingus serpentipes]